jgi:hypothetical protein
LLLRILSHEDPRVKLAATTATTGGDNWRQQLATTGGKTGGKKVLGGVAAGTGIAVLAANVLTWLWGV